MPRGLYLRTEEIRKKASIAKKGKKRPPFSKEWRKKLSKAGQNRKQSEVTKRKISESHKGKKNPFFGKHHTEEHKRKISKKIQGKNHYNWQGGITPVRDAIRKSFKYQEWKQKVFIRDKFTCQKCGDNKGGNLEAHHKKPFVKLLEEVKEYLPLFGLYEGAIIYSPLWDVKNGITYCEKCHSKIRS